MCPDGLERMRADVELVRESFAAGDPVLAEFRAPMLLHEGVSYLLEGHADQADPILAHAVDVATEARAVPAASTALAERAVVAIERHQWSEAQTLAGRAIDMVQAGNLNDYITTALVQTVAARTALHQGDIAQAQQHLGRAARLRPLLTSAMPHLAVQTLLELARAYLTLDDTAGARTVLRQAMDVLRVRPSLGTLPEQARRLQGMLDSSRDGTVRASSLSTAELRLLPLLATHLSFREMGERLHVSRHTVKSQALSVYRKLGVSSRSQAVQRMQELGLGG
jgi:LuxR family maltose regulon positive regulatory protein